MIDRRTLLGGAILGLAAVPAERAAVALAGARHDLPADAVRRDNCAFVIDMRDGLIAEIDAGSLPKNARKVVFCPLCEEHVTIAPTRDA